MCPLLKLFKSEVLMLKRSVIVSCLLLVSLTQDCDVCFQVMLVNSKIPVLEFRGCHGLARMCYTIPYGAPSPKEFSTQAKALVNALGGLDALVALLRRTNKMWV